MVQNCTFNKDLNAFFCCTASCCGYAVKYRVSAAAAQILVLSSSCKGKLCTELHMQPSSKFYKGAHINRTHRNALQL